MSTPTYSIQDQERCDHQLEYQHEANNFSWHGGSQDDPSLNGESGLKFSLRKREDIGSDLNGSSAKWMSSKMRIMRKMMMESERMATEAPTNAPLKFEDHKQPLSPLETDNSTTSNSSNNINNPIRVCADCNTTKTPLWRSGPRGPKSLCNACGIRQRKARRAMAAAAAAAANGSILAAGSTTTSSVLKTKVQNKEKKRYKKRSKLANPSHNIHGRKKKLCFEDFLISLSKNLASFHQVFPQDEKEAAILLMALSCGLAHG